MLRQTKRTAVTVLSLGGPSRGNRPFDALVRRILNVNGKARCGLFPSSGYASGPPTNASQPPGSRLLDGDRGPEWPLSSRRVFYTERQQGGWLPGPTPAPGCLAYTAILGSPHALSSRVTGGRMLADSVAKLFSVPERATLIQDQPPPGNVDSEMCSFRFDYCWLANRPGLLQHYRHICDIQQ
jgi:hypothetical protein